MKHQRGSRGPALSDSSSVQIDGAVASSTGDYDGLIFALRERPHTPRSFVFQPVLSLPIADGQTSKYLAGARARQLSVAPLLKLARVLAMKTTLVEDAGLLRRWRPRYEQRQSNKAHNAHRHVELGAATLKRMRGPVLSELGRLGAAARNAKLSPEIRSTLAQMAARARWRKQP